MAITKPLLGVLGAALVLVAAQAQSPPTNGLVAYYPFNGNANDESGNGANGVAIDTGRTVDRFGNLTNACGLNGTSSIVTLPADQLHLAGSSVATISAWLRLDRNAHKAVFAFYANRYYTPPPNPIGIIWEVLDDGRISVSTASDSDRNFSRSTVVPGRWYHLVVAYDGLAAAPSNKVRIFFDGNLEVIDQARSEVIPAAIPLDANWASLGGRARGNGLNIGFLEGSIDDVRIYNRALSAAEVQQLYTYEAPTPLVVTWGNPAAIVYGTPLGGSQLNATANLPGTFQYTPPGGTVLGAGSDQTLSVTFYPTDTLNYQPTTKTVTITVLKATPQLTWTEPAAITYGTALGAGQLNATASVPGAYVYVPAAGTVLNAGAAQALSVTFTPTDTANYQPVSRSVPINVLQATPVLTWATPAAVVYGTPLGPQQLNATANVPGAYVYTPAAGAVLNAGADQLLSVAFTPNDSLNYRALNRSVTLTVLQAAPQVTWVAPADITYGTPLGAEQLNATANIPGSFVYAPSAGVVLGAGAAQPLSATFFPADTVNYQTVTAQVALNVLRATPTLTWNNPADIAYGTRLGPDQLNASANLAGLFEYTPPPGTLLEIGPEQPLAVVFTPADAANYHGATRSVVINVLEPVPHPATAKATVVNGFVVGIEVVDPGWGYEAPPAVLIRGSEGAGATAVATVENGMVTWITVTSAGSGYTSTPKVRIASPPFMPWLEVAVSRVRVTQHVLLGNYYLLEASNDFSTWQPVGAEFMAEEEVITLDIETSDTGRYFRIRQVR